MNTKIIHMPDIGEIKIVKSRLAKNINISIKPFRGIRVSVPMHVSFHNAEAIVYKKTGWLKKSLQKISEFEKNVTVFNENTNYKTRNHVLRIQSDNRNSTSVVVSNKFINIKYPVSKNIEESGIQSAIRNGIERALRKEAKEHLPRRVAELAGKYGFKYNNVFLKNMKTRWGSCSSKGNINLNIHLMRLSDNLIDLVILHELAHTIELNHSKKFWAILDNIVGNAKLKDKELKKYKTRVF